MKLTCWCAVMLLNGFLSIGAQQTVTPKSNMEMEAIVNLRKFAMAESVYAMGHSEQGFACDPQALTKLEWPNSPEHSLLVDPDLLRGKGSYKFSAQCVGSLKPAGKLNVFAVPIDSKAELRTFCATGTFRSKPFRGTSEFPIRSLAGGTAENCLASGKPLR